MGQCLQKVYQKLFRKKKGEKSSMITGMSKKYYEKDEESNLKQGGQSKKHEGRTQMMNKQGSKSKMIPSNEHEQEQLPGAHFQGGPRNENHNKSMDPINLNPNQMMSVPDDGVQPHKGQKIYDDDAHIEIKLEKRDSVQSNNPDMLQSYQGRDPTGNLILEGASNQHRVTEESPSTKLNLPKTPDTNQNIQLELQEQFNKFKQNFNDEDQNNSFSSRQEQQLREQVFQ